MDSTNINPMHLGFTPRLLAAAYSLSLGGGGGDNIAHFLSPKAMSLGFKCPLNHFSFAVSTSFNILTDS